jgi:hypothetical protein
MRYTAFLAGDAQLYAAGPALAALLLTALLACATPSVALDSTWTACVTRGWGCRWQNLILIQPLTLSRFGDSGPDFAL